MARGLSKQRHLGRGGRLAHKPGCDIMDRAHLPGSTMNPARETVMKKEVDCRTTVRSARVARMVTHCMRGYDFFLLMSAFLLPFLSSRGTQWREKQIYPSVLGPGPSRIVICRRVSVACCTRGKREKRAGIRNDRYPPASVYAAMNRDDMQDDGKRRRGWEVGGV